MASNKLKNKHEDNLSWQNMPTDVTTKPTKSTCKVYRFTKSLKGSATKVKSGARDVGKEAIVKVFPKLSLGSDALQNEQYYQQQIHLHVPWTEQATLKDERETWLQIFDRHKANHVMSSNPSLMNGLVAEDEINGLEDLEPAHVRNEWMRLAENLPNAPLPQAEAGMRDFDEQYAWDADSERFSNYRNLSQFLAMHKGQVDDAVPFFEMPSVILTDEQESVLKLVHLQIASLEDKELAVRIIHCQMWIFVSVLF